MIRHPNYSSTLDSKTLFNSSDDDENHDLSRERLWKDRRFLNCIKNLIKSLSISKNELNKLSRNLYPAELQLQALLEILSNQKLHYTNPLKYEKSIATRLYYIKSLGLELSIQIDQLIDDSNTSFEHLKVPKYWLSILPARYIEAKHTLDCNFKSLVSKSFNLLYAHWQNSGILTQEEFVPKFHTIAKNTLGKDIGAKGTPYLFFGPQFNLIRNLKCKLFGQCKPFILSNDLDQVNYLPNNIPSVKFLHKVKQSLNKYGVTVVRNVFSKEQIREIKKTLHLNSTLARDNAFKIIERDPNVSCFKFTRGRINCVLRGTSFNESLAPLQSFWLPFVHYFMKNERKIFLSNVQLVSSDPMSYVEPWHRENKRFGLSVVIPLQDTDKQNGRIQFIPGTHEETTKANCYKSGPIGINVQEGDLLIYNSSILHRNTINESDVCQSMLIFSYDHKDTPPPGQGFVKYVFDNIYGNVIVNLNRVWSRDEVKHIGSHKFRFNDEILEVNQNVFVPKPKVLPNEKLKNSLEKAENLFKKASFMKTKQTKDVNHTQAIGYTSEDYPNPSVNPQLCLHNYHTKSNLCDPDGILSEPEQEKINQKLTNGKLKLFVTLSHNIFVESGTDKEQCQLSFGKELLRKYSQNSPNIEKNSILINYVKEFKKLKIIVGGNLYNTNECVDELMESTFDQNFLKNLEDEFEENQNEVYKSLDKVIDELNNKSVKRNRGLIILSCLLALFLLSIWGWFTYQQFNNN